MQFPDFFRTATGNLPYDYQARLAGGDSGTECNSRLINVPTGLGKTAAVVLAWMWNRVALEREDWPRRLVYCLPMRTLVERFRDNICHWLLNLRNAWAEGRIELSPDAARELLWLTGTEISANPVPSDSFRLSSPTSESTSVLRVLPFPRGPLGR